MMMQFGEHGTVFLLLIFLVVMVLLVVLYRRSNNTSGVSFEEKPSSAQQSGHGELEPSPDSDDPYKILAWIEIQRKRAESLAEEGELRKATERFSHILERLYREMANLRTLGIQSSTQLKKELEYSRDEYAARASLGELKNLVAKVDNIASNDTEEWNIENPDENLDNLMKEGMSLADDAYGLAESRSFSKILEETKQLRVRFISRIKDARKRHDDRS